MYLRRNDLVLVTKGKDRLKTGKVLRVDRDANRIVVEGVNIVKRHKKARDGAPGGILASEASISASNVRVVERPDTQGMAATPLPGRVARRMQKSKPAPKAKKAEAAPSAT
jgi:ribosomal protein L24